jgi:hypothetical protein
MGWHQIYLRVSLFVISSEVRNLLSLRHAERATVRVYPRVFFLISIFNRRIF